MGILPTEKKKIVTDPTKLNLLIYGDPGVGKSTFCSQAPGCLFFSTEDGLGAIEGYEHRCRSWRDVILGVTELETQAAYPDRPFSTICIDTIEKFILLASEEICGRRGWEDEGDGEFGKGYRLVFKTVSSTLQRMAGIPDAKGNRAYGLWMTSHVIEIEEKERGQKYQKKVPNMGTKLREDICGFVDIILFADLIRNQGSRENGQRSEDTWERVVRCHSSREWICKDRFDVLPPYIVVPKGRAWQAFTDAFNRTPTAAQGDVKPDEWAIKTWERLNIRSNQSKSAWFTDRIRELVNSNGTWSSPWLMANPLNDVHRKAIENAVDAFNVLEEKRKEEDAAFAEKERQIEQLQRQLELQKAVMREAECDVETAQKAWDQFWTTILKRTEDQGSWRNSVRSLEIVCPEKIGHWIDYLADALKGTGPTVDELEGVQQ